MTALAARKGWERSRLWGVAQGRRRQRLTPSCWRHPWCGEGRRGLCSWALLLGDGLSRVSGWKSMDDTDRIFIGNSTGMRALGTVSGLLTAVRKFHFLVLKESCKDLKEKTLATSPRKLVLSPLCPWCFGVLQSSLSSQVPLPQLQVLAFPLGSRATAEPQTNRNPFRNRGAKHNHTQPAAGWTWLELRAIEITCFWHHWFCTSLVSLKTCSHW